ncbi:MOSC domain-containing protein [Microvirga sp. ACRRW]|uniref:MOSC domain-containing protein n=1 Tax=Microvirga sp. ACRRW TaxID=2918205 RepID=UPI001EF61C62|nr:MOSC domain-containing protein [Microvirga sp. ACRRW]MCG7393028.1 MOSC domain-containing protein [Microvirga sp. ACRRW]
MNASVLAVSRSATHSFSKANRESIRLIAGLGIEGDAHAGETVKHRSRVKVDPTQPNLRQVHLIHAELFDELAEKGFSVAAGELGENVTTRGINLLSLPAGTILHIGSFAVVALTGLRNPCVQIDRFRKGLMKAVLDRDSEGQIVRKAGVMGIVLASGEVRAGDAIAVTLPPEPRRRLERV